MDSTGGNSAAVSWTSTALSSGASAVANGSSKSSTVLTGGKDTKVIFPAIFTSSNYTFFTVARYNSSSNCASVSVNNTEGRSRIFTAKTGNWLSGFWACASGLAYHEGWFTNSGTDVHGNNWVISSDCGYNSGATASQCSGKYRSQGVERNISADTNAGYPRVTINGSDTYSTELSNYQVAEVIFFNKTLSNTEVQQVETYLSSQISIQDASSNTVTGDNSTVVSVSINNSGSLIGTTTATAIMGVATFADIGISGIAGQTYTLTFTSSPSYTSVTTSVTLASANQSVLTVSSTSGIYGTALRLTTSGGSGTGAITYAIDPGGTATGCSISNVDSLTTTSSGTCKVIASKAADGNYLSTNSSSTVITISNSATSATITLAIGNLTYRSTKSISAVASVAGKVTFKANNTVLAGCKNLSVTAGNSFTRSCNYRPSTRGYITISVTLVPTDTSYNSSVTQTGRYFVYQRSGSR